MPTVTSKDGTTLEYDRSGSGPAVVLLYVGPFTRVANAGLAALLAEHHTVYSYDRRGRGGSGGSVHDGPDREFEDLHAILEQAGGSAFVYGSSGGGIMGLQAAARGLRITRLAAWEPPYAVVPGAPRPPADWGHHVATLVGQDRRGDAVAYWMTSVTGMPEQMVAGMRQAPFWPAVEAEAHGLIADYALVGDLTFDAAMLASVRVPTLVLDGGTRSPFGPSAAEVAATVPGAVHQSLDGQPHNVADEAMAAALIAFFK
jgi:pimeloyl-ACP methyl ester carboxylesterase